MTERLESSMLGRKRIARLMRQHGLHARHAPRLVVTTNSDHGLPVAENVLDRRFAVEVPKAR